jgi:hypothetical protein
MAAFADIFNDMSVLAYDNSTGKAIGWKPVPVSIGPKEKVVAALIAEDPDNPDSVYAPDNYLPRISINWTGIARDTERQRGQLDKRRLFVEYIQSDEAKAWCDGQKAANNGQPAPEGTEVVYDPNSVSPVPAARIDTQTVPYILNIEMTIWTKYMDDMAQLLENILPFFNPDAPVSLYERGVGTERIVQVKLDSISPNFVMELTNTDRRVLQANLSFQMELNFYKPEEPIAKPIKRVTVRIATDSTKGNKVNITGIDKKPTASADGETVNVAALPCLSGSCDYLDLDKRIASIITEFDGNTRTYMAETYHNVLDPETQTQPTDVVYTNPNDNETEDIFYGLYGDQFDMAMSLYNFTIPAVQYENEAFVPNGQTVSLDWTPVVIMTGVVDECGREGTLYQGVPVDTSDVSGTYYVINPNSECDELDDERTCDE